MYFVSLLSLLIYAINGLDDPDSLQNDLDSNRNLFDNTLGNDQTSYCYSYQRSCFCIVCFVQEILLCVDGNSNQVISAEFYDKTDDEILDICIDQDTIDSVLSSDFPTINDLFDNIQGYIDDDIDLLTVTYDDTYGYPFSIYADITYQIADEEYSVTVTCFSEPNTTDNDQFACIGATFSGGDDDDDDDSDSDRRNSKSDSKSDSNSDSNSDSDSDDSERRKSRKNRSNRGNK